jgi:thioredoxin 1
MVIEITDQNFEEEVLKSSLPVLIDLWAPWCGPCRMVSPLIERLSQRYSGKFKFCKLNIDVAPKIARKYHIMSIPTLMFFKDGEVADTVVGAVPERVLQTKLDSLL